MSIFLFNHTEGKQYKFLPQLCTITEEKEKTVNFWGQKDVHITCMYVHRQKMMA